MKKQIKTCLLVVLLIICLIVAGCDPYKSYAEQFRLKKVEQTKSLMGTEITITALDVDSGKAKEAVESAFLELQYLESLFSDYDGSTEVGRLNQKGHLGKPSPHLFYVLNKSAYYGGLSGGAFDITVKPVLELYSYSFGELSRPPTDEEIAESLAFVDYSSVAVSSESVSFIKDDMKITLGGIAKGYAIDLAVDTLKRKGIEHGLVNAGGDMKALGYKEEKQPWKIALQNPRDESDYVTMIGIEGIAVTTSGDYERYYDDSKKAHHILDPKTGKSATSLISVTIIAKEAVDADALATAVFVMGAEKGLELVESLDDVEALVITSEKEVIRSSGFDGFELSDDS